MSSSTKMKALLEEGLINVDLDPMESEDDFVRRYQFRFPYLNEKLRRRMLDSIKPKDAIVIKKFLHFIIKKLTRLDGINDDLKKMKKATWPAQITSSGIVACMRFWGGYENTAVRFLRQSGMRMLKAKCMLLDAIKFRHLELPKVLNLAENRSKELYERKFFAMCGVPFVDVKSVEDMKKLARENLGENYTMLMASPIKSEAGTGMSTRAYVAPNMNIDRCPHDATGVSSGSGAGKSLAADLAPPVASPQNENEYDFPSRDDMRNSFSSILPSPQSPLLFEKEGLAGAASGNAGDNVKDRNEGDVTWKTTLVATPTTGNSSAASSTNCNWESMSFVSAREIETASESGARSMDGKASPPPTTRSPPPTRTSSDQPTLSELAPPSPTSWGSIPSGAKPSGTLGKKPWMNATRSSQSTRDTGMSTDLSGGSYKSNDSIDRSASDRSPDGKSTNGKSTSQGDGRTSPSRKFSPSPKKKKKKGGDTPTRRLLKACFPTPNFGRFLSRTKSEADLEVRRRERYNGEFAIEVMTDTQMISVHERNSDPRAKKRSKSGSHSDGDQEEDYFSPKEGTAKKGRQLDLGSVDAHVLDQKLASNLDVSGEQPRDDNGDLVAILSNITCGNLAAGYHIPGSPGAENCLVPRGDGQVAAGARGVGKGLVHPASFRLSPVAEVADEMMPLPEAPSFWKVVAGDKPTSPNVQGNCTVSSSTDEKCPLSDIHSCSSSGQEGGKVKKTHNEGPSLGSSKVASGTVDGASNLQTHASRTSNASTGDPTVNTDPNMALSTENVLKLDDVTLSTSSNSSSSFADDHPLQKSSGSGDEVTHRGDDGGRRSRSGNVSATCNLARPRCLDPMCNMEIFLSKDGIPVEYWRVHTFDFHMMWQEFSYQEIEVAYIQYLEAKERLCRAVGSRSTYIFVDIDGCTISWVAKQIGPFTKFAKLMTYYGEVYYPDAMEKATMLHAPYFVGLGWNVVSALLSANSKALVGICSGNKLPKELQDGTIDRQYLEKMKNTLLLCNLEPDADAK